MARKQDAQQLNDKPIISASITGNESLEGENGMFLVAVPGSHWRWHAPFMY